MRLLLDAHISGRVVGRTLSEDGYDVRAIDAEKGMEGLQDPDLLELAISDGRILVSANVGDFMALIKKLNEAGRSHPGCILVPNTIRNEDFRAIIAGVRTLLEGTTGEEWTDLVRWIRR